MRRWITPFIPVSAVLALAAIVSVSLALWVDTETNAANTLGTDTLAAPTSLTASDTPPGSVTLNWTPTASTWAGGYNVHRGTTSGCCYSFLAAVPGQASSSYVDPVGGGGFETITFQSVATASASSGVQSLVIAKPSGTAQDDLLIAVLSTDTGESGENFSPPAGWTVITDRETSGVSPPADDNLQFAVWYKVATAAEPADYTFTWGSDEDAVGAILRYDGVNPSTPIDASADAVGSSAAPQAPTVTTTVSNAMVVRLFGSNDDDLPTPVGDVYPAGTIGRYAQETDGGGGDTTSAGADAIQAVAGATGTADFTLAASEKWVATTVALIPNPLPPATYYYVVEATFQNWTSPFSNEASGDGQTPVVGADRRLGHGHQPHRVGRRESRPRLRRGTGGRESAHPHVRHLRRPGANESDQSGLRDVAVRQRGDLGPRRGRGRGGERQHLRPHLEQHPRRRVLRARLLRERESGGADRRAGLEQHQQLDAEPDHHVGAGQHER